MRHQLGMVAAVAGYFLVACGTSGSNSSGDIERTATGKPLPSSVVPAGDPFVQEQRVPGSTFVEILEVTALADKRVMYCSGVRGLVILDASDPGTLKPVHKLKSKLSHKRFPRCQHLAVEGKYVYITNRGDEVQTTPFVAAFNVSTDAPKEVATFSTKDVSIEGVAAAGKHVFLAAHDKGLLVLEHRGESLKQIASLGGLQNAWDVVIDGSTLYVADGKAGLVVVDVTTPSKPVITGRARFDGNSQSLTFDASTKTAWVAAGVGGVVAVDTSDKANPKVVGTYDSPGSALQVAVADGYAYVADWNDVRILDIKDRTKPRVVASERIKSPKGYPRVLGVSAYKNYAYIGEWTGLYAYKFDKTVAAPDLWLETERLDFGMVAKGKADKSAVIIENHGTKKLTVSAIEVKGASAFTIDTKNANLAPGSAALIQVTFTPANSDEQKAELVLRSDDPDEPERRVLLSGNKSGKGVGQQSAEVVGKLLAGGDFKLANLRGKVVVLAYFSTF